MNNLYIFGHRGASGYSPGNTMTSFRKAVEFKVGIETDVRLTKDNKLICFHDPVIRLGNSWKKVNDLSFKELNLIRFKDGKKVPLIKNVFESFKKENYDLKYSFDIGSKKAGKRLVEIAAEYELVPKIQINVTSYQYIRYLRNNFRYLKVVFTVPHEISKIDNSKIDFGKLHELDIKIINIRRNKHLIENFRYVIENDFQCYVWGINSKSSMKRIIELNHKGEGITAAYTDYPDVLKSLVQKKETS